MCYTSMGYQTACQAQAFQYRILTFSILMDSVVMSLKPQVMKLIKHHVNLKLDISLQTSQPGCGRLYRDWRH